MPPLPEVLSGVFSGGTAIDPVQVSMRLLLALVFGGLVALVYRASRPAIDTTHSFSATLVLLTILIAMVTQVIGDSVARAFSLVGALSIVRFRTVVRDTQDTAYVIFAVVVGMAVGASDPWVALIGVFVVAIAAAVLRLVTDSAPGAVAMPYLVSVRMSAGLDPATTLAPTLDRLAKRRRLVSLSTARQGTAFDVSYRAAIDSEGTAAALVAALTGLAGVLSVTIERSDAGDN